eukprot:scaffold4929_cov94-Skeletonema_dohrnii-CCMP3373.AAC.2
MPSAWRKLLAAVPHHQSTQQLKNDFRSLNQSSQRAARASSLRPQEARGKRQEARARSKKQATSNCLSNDNSWPPAIGTVKSTTA